MTDVLVTGNLTVNGTSEMKQKLTVRTDSFFTGFLRVGALAATGYNVLAIADITQNLGVGGDTTMTGMLTVNGSAGILSEGPVIINDILRTNPPYGIICGGQLAVANVATLQQNLNVGGNVTISGLYAKLTSLTVNNNLTVSGKATLGDATIAGNLNVTSNTTLTGAITASGTLVVSGDIIIAGNLTASGAGGIQSEGPVIISDILRTNPPFGIVCGGDFAVAGTATFQENVAVSHLIAAGPVPTLAGAGTFSSTFTASMAAASHDVCGFITITNTGPAAATIVKGDSIQVNFAAPYPVNPDFPASVIATVVALFSPSNNPTNIGTCSFQISLVQTTSFALTFLQPSNSIAAGGSVLINWICVGNFS